MSEGPNNDIRSKRRPRLNISEAVELLIVIALGFSFFQLSMSDRLLQLLTNLFVATSVLNFWLTTRVSFAVYSAKVFLVDIFSIAILFGMIVQAGVSGDGIYPPPVFWLLVAALEASYALWDVLLAGTATHSTAKKTFRLWTALSIIAVLGCVAAFVLGLPSFAEFGYDGITHIVGFSSLAYIFVMNVVWNAQLFLTNKATNDRDLI
ncbi:MAG: hypothetical protein ABJM26_20625 [Anderseniella sp.]